MTETITITSRYKCQQLRVYLHKGHNKGKQIRDLPRQAVGYKCPSVLKLLLDAHSKDRI